MRCLACDVVLTKMEETSRRYKSSGKFVDLCNHCFSTIEDSVQTVTKHDSGEPTDDFQEE